MDLSIFPAVGILMFVLLSIPTGDKAHAQNIAKYSVTKSTTADLDVSYPRRNRFRRRVAEESKESKEIKKSPVARNVASAERSRKSGRLMGGTPQSQVQHDPSITSTTSYSNKKKKPRRMEIDLDQKEDDLNYKSIYKYIRKKYKRVPKEEADQIAKALVEYGRKNNLDPKFAAALMARESAFNRRAISSSGAKGLGQIKDMNYRSLGISDPYDIRQNAKGTVQYMKRMLTIWKGKSEKVSLALASYYKGHGAVKRDKEQLDRTTKGYVGDILQNYETLKSMKARMK